MHQLGQTSSVHRRDHAVLTPETLVRAPLPGMKKGTAIVHAAPAMGAAFTQYTAELEAGGCLADLPESCERFLYVLDGKVSVEFTGERHTLARNDYAYIPVEIRHSCAAAAESRVAVIDKRYRVPDGSWNAIAFVDNGNPAFGSGCTRMTNFDRNVSVIVPGERMPFPGKFDADFPVKNVQESLTGLRKVCETSSSFQLCGVLSERRAHSRSGVDDC